MKLKSLTDTRGNLTPVEFKGLPFIPKRIFIVDSVPAGFRRGCHAHYVNKQFLICLKGKVRVGIHDGGCYREHILNPNEGLLVENLVWDHQDFLTGNDILLVLCSTAFNKSDYIKDFRKFIKIGK